VLACLANYQQAEEMKWLILRFQTKIRVGWPTKERQMRIDFNKLYEWLGSECPDAIKPKTWRAFGEVLSNKTDRQLSLF